MIHSSKIDISCWIEDIVLKTQSRHADHILHFTFTVISMYRLTQSIFHNKCHEFLSYHPSFFYCSPLQHWRSGKQNRSPQCNCSTEKKRWLNHILSLIKEIEEAVIFYTRCELKERQTRDREVVHVSLAPQYTYNLIYFLFKEYFPKYKIHRIFLWRNYSSTLSYT